MSRENHWCPQAGLEMLRARADLLSRIREFFAQAGVMEVETPVCSAYATTDPALESLFTRYVGPGFPEGRRLFLQTSPEFPMKRLLAAGSGPIYQICKAFRDGEQGRLHNPEFTLLEWYRPGFDHHRLMQEVADLVNGLLPSIRAVESMSYAEAFQGLLGIDPHRASCRELRQYAEHRTVPGAADLQLDRDGWLDLLLTHLIEPHLGQGTLTFIYDYPASQAALARIRSEDIPVAERFELYVDGVELANGFHELADAEEQRRRFDAGNERRREQGKEPLPVDRRLLDALRHGLPDCSGVALGIDRLLMLVTGVSRLDQVLAFPLGYA